MSGRTEMGYEKGLTQLSNKMADFEDHVATCIFSILILYFLFPFSLLMAKAAPLPSNVHYANF